MHAGTCILTHGRDACMEIGDECQVNFESLQVYDSILNSMHYCSGIYEDTVKCVTCNYWAFCFTVGVSFYSYKALGFIISLKKTLPPFDYS